MVEVNTELNSQPAHQSNIHNHPKTTLKISSSCIYFLMSYGCNKQTNEQTNKRYNFYCEGLLLLVICVLYPDFHNEIHIKYNITN